MMDSTALWTITELARYLKRSNRWVFTQLSRQSSEPGSIPHVRLPGRHGGVRFDPDAIRAWLAAGCPPAADFAAMRETRANRKESR